MKGFLVLLSLGISVCVVAEPDHSDPGGARPTTGTPARAAAADVSSTRYQALGTSILELLQNQQYAQACAGIETYFALPESWECRADGWHPLREPFVDRLLASSTFTREALETCRHRQNAEAAAALQASTKNGYDRNAIASVVQKYPLTQAALEALALSGSIHLELGEYELAAIQLENFLRRWDAVERLTGRNLSPGGRMIYRLATAMVRAGWPQAERDRVIERLRRETTPNGLTLGRKTFAFAALRDELNRVLPAPSDVRPYPTLAKFLAGSPGASESRASWDLALAQNPERFRAFVRKEFPAHLASLPLPTGSVRDLSDDEVNADDFDLRCHPDGRAAGTLARVPTFSDPGRQERSTLFPRLSFGVDVIATDPSVIAEPIVGLRRLAYTPAPNRNPMGGTTITSIARNSSLRALELPGISGSSAVSLEPLAALPRLESLRVARMSAAHAGQVARFAQLERLRLDFADDDVLAALGASPRLTALEVETVGGSAEGLARWSQPTRLRTLNLGSLQVTAKGAQALGRFTGLHKLSLRDARIARAGAGFLSQLRELRELDLEEATFEGRFVSQVASLPSLETLNLTKTGIVDFDLQQLQKSTKLKKLSLEDNRLTDEVFESLAKLTELRELNLAYTQVTGTGIAALGALRNLETLNLSGTELTPGPELRRELGELGHLKTLILGPHTPSDTVDFLQQVLPRTEIHLE